MTRPVAMRVLIVSGIWPPEVGGPASHGPELGGFLKARGHDVRAVTTAGTAGVERPDFPLRVARRDRPPPLRVPAAAAAIAREARAVDVVYATGLYSRSALACTVGRRPLVLKLASDPAYERARRWGLFNGSLEEFQSNSPSPRIELLKRIRRLVVAQAERLVIPSEYLARIVRDWGLSAERIAVIPNPAPDVNGGLDRAAARERLGVRGPTFVFAGRLARQKNVPLAVSAVARVPGASLVVIGDGPEGGAVERAIEESRMAGRVMMAGPLPRATVLDWLAAADAAVLPSDWENFPHAAVEALAVGTPVIGTTVGGVPEIIRDRENGLLVPPADSAALASAMSSVTADRDLLARLRRGAAESVGRYSPARLFGEIEREIELAAGR